MPSKPGFRPARTDHFPPTGNPCDPDECGLLIGVGSQYTVHDLGDGRVVKIPNSMDGTRRFVGGWGPHYDASTAHRPIDETVYHREECAPHVLRLAARYPPLSAALGNPQAVPGGSFTQDKVRPLIEVIGTASPDEIRGYLADYADLCLLFWRYGIHEYILNFGTNNGVDAKGRLVLMDFGEVAFVTTFVARMVARREWESKALWVEKYLPAEFHDYYFEVMVDRLSGQDFELHWGVALDDLDREVIGEPKLNERKEEISGLVARLLARANREEGWDIRGVSAEGLGLYSEYGWKHGVEFQNVLYRAAEKCRGRIIRLDDIPPYVHEKVNGEQ